MSRVEIGEKHDPKTAWFWARFAAEKGQQDRHCPTMTLYQNLDGEFFSVNEQPGITPIFAYLISDPSAWLAEQLKWFEDNR